MRDRLKFALEEGGVFEELLGVDGVEGVVAEDAEVAVLGLLGKGVGDELTANPVVGFVEEVAEAAVGPGAEEAVNPLAEPGVGGGFGEDEAGVVTAADFGSRSGGNARAEVGVPAEGLAEEDAAGGVVQIFGERGAGDAFIEVGFDAFILAANNKGVGDANGAVAMPAFKVGDAGGDKAGNVGETDVAHLEMRSGECGVRNWGWGGCHGGGGFLFGDQGIRQGDGLAAKRRKKRKMELNKSGGKWDAE